MSQRHSRVVVAYSGGLDTSVIVRWVLEHRADEVIAFTADEASRGGLEELFEWFRVPRDEPEAAP